MVKLKPFVIIFNPKLKFNSKMNNWVLIRNHVIIQFSIMAQ